MNLINPQTVVIIVDPKFSEMATELSQRLTTWIVDTPQNKQVYKEIPRSEIYGFEEKINFFEADTSVSAEQQFIDVMEDFIGHPWVTLKVHGVPPTFLISDVLKSGYRVIHIEPTATGFTATRMME